MPKDPFSAEYAARQLELYREVSGRADYQAVSAEQSRFDVESAVCNPYPYFTHSAKTVGDQLIAQGQVIAQLDVPAHSRVLEFGPGWGNLTLQMAQMGHHVTAVDICPEFLELIRRRAALLSLSIETACREMLAFETDKPFDAIVFFESFHHCSDHLKMLDRLHDLLRPDGLLIFAREPITPTSHGWGRYPWGVRLDGLSVLSTRKFGWLELGFTHEYFLKALDRTGWSGTITRDHAGSIVSARAI
jgi:2-polyprenyl-3-methyl-5-hydroxy-6-metoxy-1,4-benzoquinol methylase